MTACKVAKKLDFGDGAETCLNEVNDLGYHQLRDNERTRMRFEKLQACDMVSVAPVYRSIQGAGVDQQRYGRTS